MLDSPPLLEEIWEASVLENLKLSSLTKFDGCSNSYENMLSPSTYR